VCFAGLFAEVNHLAIIPRHLSLLVKLKAACAKIFALFGSNNLPGLPRCLDRLVCAAPVCPLGAACDHHVALVCRYLGTQHLASAILSPPSTPPVSGCRLVSGDARRGRDASRSGRLPDESRFTHQRQRRNRFGRRVHAWPMAPTLPIQIGMASMIASSVPPSPRRSGSAITSGWVTMPRC
jgi:hypothetical protein